MSHSIPQGITPPIPGQEKEEPDLWQEDDIPKDEDSNAKKDHPREQPRKD
jgi:hypothetical protein